MWERPFFISEPRIGSIPYVLPGVVGRSLPFVGGLLEDIEVILEIPIYWIF